MDRLTPERLAEIARFHFHSRADVLSLLSEVRALTEERDDLADLEAVSEAARADAAAEIASLRATVAAQGERIGQVETRAGAMREAIEGMTAWCRFNGLLPPAPVQDLVYAALAESQRDGGEGEG